MARPQLPPDERRDEFLPNLRVTAAERVQVEKSAEKVGLSLAEFCRRAIFRVRVSPPASKVDAAAVAELNRIGVNLNQIARHMNAGRNPPADLSVTISELRGILARVVKDGS